MGDLIANVKRQWPQTPAQWEAWERKERERRRNNPETLLPSSLVSGSYSRHGMEVEVDQDAFADHPTGPAVVLVHDHERWLVYSVVAERDSSGRARLISVSVWPADDPFAECPWKYLDERPRRSDQWLARTAVECWRGAQLIPAEMDDDEQLRYVAQVARECAQDGTSAVEILTKALRVSPRTVTRLRNRAVAAGYLDPHEGGRPRKSTPTQETPDE